MSDTKEREQLVTALRASDFAGYRTGEAANLIEQQAKELAEAHERVVVLSEALENAASHFDTHMLHGGAHKCRQALASTDTAAQTLREKWIPVSERLPEPDTYVLYYNGKYTGFGKWVSGEWCESDERWQTDFGEYIELLGPKITHWQPLPEPPKEKP